MTTVQDAASPFTKIILPLPVRYEMVPAFQLFPFPSRSYKKARFRNAPGGELIIQRSNYNNMPFGYIRWLMPADLCNNKSQKYGIKK